MQSVNSKWELMNKVEELSDSIQINLKENNYALTHRYMADLQCLLEDNLNVIEELAKEYDSDAWEEYNICY